MGFYLIFCKFIEEKLRTMIMKTHTKFLSVIFFAAAFAVVSCKKDPVEEPPVPEFGSIAIEFENMVGDSVLELNSDDNYAINGDTFTVTMFKYYISNIKLASANGTFTEPESYHLIDQSVPGSFTFTIDNIPVGDYTGISFMIGVDSTRNVSGVQTGALDPANGMFWSWSSGYIMAKFEGTSPQSGGSSHNLIYHTGGFSGVNSVLRTVGPSFNGAIANVTKTETPVIHIAADLAEWFVAPANIDFATTYTIHMPGTAAKMIADNYADMFSVEHIHN